MGESAQSCSSLSARESSVFSRYNKIEVFTEDHDDTDNEHSSFLFESKQDHMSQSGSRNTSASGTHITVNEKDQMLSPVKRMFKRKKEDIIEKKAELPRKKSEKAESEKAEFISKIERGLKMVIELEGDEACCGNCHLPGHTIKRCKNMECRTAEFCGLLKRHKDDRDRLEKMEKNIAELDRTIKTLECTLEKRKQTYNSIECGTNQQIEQMLSEEYNEDYFQCGLKNWVRLNKDIAFIKRSFGKTWKSNLSEVKKVMQEK